MRTIFQIAEVSGSVDKRRHFSGQILYSAFLKLIPVQALCLGPTHRATCLLYCRILCTLFWAAVFVVAAVLFAVIFPRFVDSKYLIHISDTAS